MKRLSCIIFVLIFALMLAGCGKPLMPDAENVVKEVVFSVIDGEETLADEAQSEKILRMYAECKNFWHNRDNAGITPPNPVEIVIRYEDGRKIVIYHPGTHKIGIRDENGESWFAENEELYVYLDELQEEEYTTEIEEVTDPGPPTLWQFYSLEEYFAMEEALNLSDEELEAYAGEHELSEVPGFSSVRETGKRVRVMMREVSVPQTDGCEISYMDVNAEEGRTSVFFRLMGESTIHVLYSFDAEWEKEQIANLGKNGEEQIWNLNVAKLYFTEHDENTDGLQIYRFGAVVNGKYVRIFVFGGTFEDAKEAVSRMTFRNIGQMQGEEPEVCEADTVRFDSLEQFQDYLVTTTAGSDIADLGSLESYWLPEDIPEDYVLYKITAGIVDIGFWYLPRDIVEQGETFGAEARGKHYLFISPRNGNMEQMGMYLPEDGETGERKLLGRSAINAYEVSVER